MDKAKENKIGEVRIVNSEQIKKEYNRTISHNEKKFFCINCGEYVTYVNGYKKKAHFKHRKNTDETKYCEERVDQPELLSVYQKVGLQIYLKRDTYNNFNLFIGFYPIGKSLINTSEYEQRSIKILGVKNSSNYKKEYCINNINFYPDKITLKQINFISTKYKIDYSDYKSENLLSDKWGYEIEGINTPGSLFKFGENGGRKIRINEEIIEDTDYICISKNDNTFRYLNGVDYQEIGNISTLNEYLKVYKIKFILNSIDDKKIKKLVDFCREEFKVSLVSRASQIISLWPPTINDDKKIELFYEKNNLLLLKSAQPNAKVFRHKFKSNMEINLNRIDENKYTFKVSPSINEVAININDEYNSEYLLVYKYKDKIKTFNNEIIIKDINENVIEEGIHNNLPSDGKVKIFSNSQVDIIQYRNDIPFKLYKVKKKEIIINNLKYDDKLVVKRGLKKITLVKFEKLKKDTIKEPLNDIEIYKRLKSLSGPFIPVDTCTRVVFRNLKIYPKTFNLLKSYILKNKMPIGIRKILNDINIK